MNQMASNTEDAAVSLQEIFANLRSSSSRSYSADKRQDGSPASRGTAHQSSPFNFAASPNPVRSTSLTQSNSQSPSLPPSLTGFQSQGNGSRNVNPPQPQSAISNPNDQSGADRTANLLNLLKFNRASSLPQQQLSVSTTKSENGGPQIVHNPGLQNAPAQGLFPLENVAFSMDKLSVSPNSENGNQYPVVSTTSDALKTAGKPQDYLLQLLNRPKPSQNSVLSVSPQAQTFKPSVAETGAGNISQDLAKISLQTDSQSISTKRDASASRDSPIRIFGSTDSKEPTPFDPQRMPSVEPQSEPIFTYVNPFEQLAASSPRNTSSRSRNVTPQRESKRSKNMGSNMEGHKRKSKESSPEPSHLSSKRRLTPGGNEILQSIESPSSAPLEDGRSRLEALIGIGAPTTDVETVAEALNEVGEQVSRQVDHALAQADEIDQEKSIKEEDLEAEDEALLSVVEKKLQEVAAEVKSELDKKENSDILETIMPKLTADTVREVIDEAAEGNVEGVRHNQDDESKTPKADDSAIEVFNFPLKPWVSIDLKQEQLASQNLREDAVMEIARLKKEFDQIDRTLATASIDFILYAMPKVGGLRIIRQIDGLDRQVFKETKDRVFNASISTRAPGHTDQELQTFIATAVSGSVYWGNMDQSGKESSNKDELLQHNLAFPPVPTYEENSSGGQLKTRAKKSTRHPEFFAIGRGKSIQIVFPLHARASGLINSSFVVDTEKYFKERSLKINTGKAGKDFTFSEDDTMIITLDKAGRLRFWDIRDLVNESNGSASRLAPIEVKTPVLSLSTALPTEKSWPTSVLFVDKIRPYAKGTALRYVIVGMKQNHTLQLWDLGLQKAVQELNFPHQNESDPICSVNYHPASGIIVVGHPKRNSIYFVHLSVPKYSLLPMSQAKYVQGLANKEPKLSKVDATAIMSGIREYSFSSKGQLRSIDLLPTSSDKMYGDDPPLFELYVMHSKGVTSLSIKKEDLGWTQDNKVVRPVNAEKAGLIIVKDLRDAAPAISSEPSSVNGDVTPKVSTQATKTANELPKEMKEFSDDLNAKSADEKKDEKYVAGSRSIRDNSHVAAINGASDAGEKSEKKKKKRSTPVTGDSAPAIPPTAPVAPTSYAAAVQRARSPSSRQSRSSSRDTRLASAKTPLLEAAESGSVSSENSVKRKIASAESFSLGISSEFLNKELKKIEKSVSQEFSKALAQELETLYRRFDEDKRVQDAAGGAKQEAVLRLISTTLTDNVEKALSRIVNTSIQEVVLPSVTEVTTSVLNKKIPESLTTQLLHTLPAQLKLALPEAVSRSVQNPDVIRVLSDQITSKVANQVEKQFSNVLHQTITPAFHTLAIGNMQKIGAETERRLAEQLSMTEMQRQDDKMKINQLVALVQGLSETVQTMAAAQSEFQSEILRLQQSQSVRILDSDFGSSEEREMTAQEKEIKEIKEKLRTHLQEEATIQWLQSNQQAELFDRIFIQEDPKYLQECQSLVVLSVGAAVTASFEKNIMDRLVWLQTVFETIDMRDPDLRTVGPQIMTVLSQRLESQFMRIAEVDRNSPVLNDIVALRKKANDIALMISSMA